MNNYLRGIRGSQSNQLIKSAGAAGNHHDTPVNGLINDEDDDDIVQKSSIISYDNDYEDKRHQKDKLMNKTMKGKLFNQIQDDQESGENNNTTTTPKSLKRQLKALREAIAELYLGIKQKTRDENEVPTIDEEQEERDIIMSLDSYVIIEYINSSVDIILNLKFEEIEKRLMDKNTNNDRDEQEEGADKDQRSSRDTLRSDGGVPGGNNFNSEHSTSQQTQNLGPPKVYEELIQSLEADVRKHIRIEQQLKLHIENMENRIEELENQNEKYEHENAKFKKNQSIKSKEVTELLQQKDEVAKHHESEIQKMRETESELRQEIEHLRDQFVKMSKSKAIVDPFTLINQAIDNATRGSIDNTCGIALNKTQPMIIKQNSVSIKDHQGVKQSHPDFGSYSSNQSYAENNNSSSPDRRATPDLTNQLLMHPYLHQTQVVPKKKAHNIITPGSNGVSKSANKSSKQQNYITPNAASDSLNGGGIIQTYSVQCSSNNTNKALGGGGVMGQRKLSSQHSRNNNNNLAGQPIAGCIKTTVPKNSWIGGGGMAPGSQQFSNIINNNIQGLSINYSNQIIQQNPQGNPAAAAALIDPIQQFANNFIVQNKMITTTEMMEDSESSNLNSHRRCKSQNVKRDSRSAENKSIDSRKKSTHLKKIQYKQQQQHQQQLIQDLSQEDLIQNSSSLFAANPTKYRKQHTQKQGIDGGENGQFILGLNESTRLGPGDFLNSEQQQQLHRRALKAGNSSSINNSHILTNASGTSHSKVRTASNRVHQHQQAIDEFSKNRFNQSYGGGTNGQASAVAKKTNSITGGGITMATRNLLPSGGGGGTLIGGATSQSLEKGSRSRNKKNQLSNNHTTVANNSTQGGAGNYPSKFEGIDMNFKTTSSTSNQKQQMGSKSNGNSATNNQAFLNQTNIHYLKQQILAHKKASNLLMKGLSPLKKQQ